MITNFFEAIVKSDRNGMGVAGETYASHLLKKAGYDVRKNDNKFCGDLRAADLKTGQCWNIEVKTAKKRPDGKFCFQLIVDGQTDYRYSDYVLLLAVNTNGIVISYIIPVPVLKRRGAKTITLPANLNNCKWAYYRVKSKVRLTDGD